MSIEAIAGMLDGWRARRLSAGGHVYHLDRQTRIPFLGTARLHERQLTLLRRIRTLPWTRFLYHDEDPRDWEAAGHWQRESDNTWKVPHDVGSVALMDFLGPGGWCLYLADAPLAEARMADLSDAPDRMIEFTARHGIPLLVQAYFDNAFWRITLQPAAGADNV